MASEPAVTIPAATGRSASEPVAFERAASGGPTGSTPQVVLAFDFGRRRIGAACGDTISRTAAPLSAVPADARGPRWEMIDTLVREWQPSLIVVGLPYNVDGSDSTLTSAAREFAAALERRCRLPVALVDERYSSREAEARLKSAREAGLRRRRVAKADVDAAAACVILERWFTEQT
jgi:putative pre-16S rRNA nuclease